jgi:hypothetical protein
LSHFGSQKSLSQATSRSLERANPCDFNEFLQALQSSETIRAVTCKSQVRLRISEYQWVLLVRTLGRIKDIQHLEFFCQPGSRDFYPFQGVADAVKNAHSLCKLTVLTYLGSLNSYPSGLIALANALREHTALQEFTWKGCDSRRGPRDFSLDPVFRALPACPHLREVHILARCASAVEFVLSGIEEGAIRFVDLWHGRMVPMDRAFSWGDCGDESDAGDTL